MAVHESKFRGRNVDVEIEFEHIKQAKNRRTGFYNYLELVHQMPLASKARADALRHDNAQQDEE